MNIIQIISLILSFGYLTLISIISYTMYTENQQ